MTYKQIKSVFFSAELGSIVDIEFKNGTNGTYSKSGTSNANLPLWKPLGVTNPFATEIHPNLILKISKK